MTRRISLAILATFAVATMASAQLPPGEWWRRPEVVRTLGLTTDQQNRLDSVFRGAANELIDLRGETQKLMLALRGELSQSHLNRQNLQRLATRLGEARGKLFERELMMLVDMRAVLSDEQWHELRSELDRRQDRQQQQQQQPVQRPNMQRQPRRP